ncbi:MAG: Do family serine endopeptidase [Candidatus Omnitrophota bacterium]
MKKIIFFSTILAVGIILGLVLAIRLDIFSRAESKVQDPVIQAPASVAFEDAVANIVGNVGKSVVSISTEHTERSKRTKRYRNSPFGEWPFGEDERFRGFFDDFFEGVPQRNYRQVGLGSGVIIDPEGYILTNEHVVSGADKITVSLADGREFKGEIKGQDARSDLAVIKINARDLPAATLGDSSNLKIGQWVVAVGNPFGFAMDSAEPTVTVGVISALHRSLGRALFRNKDYGDMIQTDAAINPGNSGGPLVNLRGEVIAVNVAIFSTSGGYQGVGFAIPINNAKAVISRLIQGKRILYGWLGITVQDLTPEMSKYFDLAEKEGILIAKTLENSPAQKAGMKEGDIIRKFDNKNIRSTKELVATVSKTEIGRRVTVELIRDKKPLKLDVEIGERPQDLEKTSQAEAVSADNWRGIEADDISPQIARRFRIEDKQGVVVVNVEPDSPADLAGLNTGDVILEIDKHPVKNMAAYKKIIQGLKGASLVRTSRGYFLIQEGQGE